MTDVNVNVPPSFEKAGFPGPKPKASHQPVGAPPTAGQPFLAVCPPAPPHLVENEHGNAVDRLLSKTDLTPEGRRNGNLDSGSGKSLGAPKPAEVTSVPETPVNNSTPVGGTPRPELQIAEEPVPSAAETPPEPVLEPAVAIGAQEAKPLLLTSAPPEKQEKLSAPIEKSISPGKADPAAMETSVTNGSTSGTAVIKDKEPSENGAMDIDRPKKQPEPPVTHTGPEAESVPAPAPAPAPITSSVAVEAAMAENDSSETSAPEAVPELSKSKPGSSEPVADVGGKRKLDEAAVTEAVESSHETGAAPPLNAGPSDKKAKIAEPLAEAPPSLNGSSPQTKLSKAKKEKKQPAVGRTARKTRSQGPADV